MNLLEVGWGYMDCIDLTQNRDNWICECGNEPSSPIKSGIFTD